MYAKIITLFNYIEQNDEYTSTLINNVEFQPIYKTIPNDYETADDTSALVIINYSKDDTGVYVNSNSSKKYYLKPKQWENSSKEGYFTIQNNTDFIVLGDYTNLVDVNLNQVKNTTDDVFIINKFKDFMDELKHFELYVN